MRLTLRTLLAWRDGLLQGPERDVLSAKVAASSVAPRLVERMDDLGKRADLPASDADANLVAEFLDNSLVGAPLEAYERACLESEAHLGEVADCHGLLAELLRDATVSAPLDASCLERLLGVVSQHAPSPQGRAPSEDTIAIGAIMRDAKAAATRSATVLSKQPARASVGAWVSAGVAIVLLLLLSGLLIRSIVQPAGGSRQVAVVERAARSKEVPVVTEPPAPAEPAPADGDHAAPAPSAMEPAGDRIEASESSVSTVTDGSSDAAPFRPIDDGTSPFPPASDASVIPLPVMEGDDAVPDGSMVVEETARPVAQPPRAPSGNVLQVVAGGPLLHRESVAGGQSRWRAVFAGTTLSNVDEFVVPAHCYPQIVWGNLSLRLFPSTRGAMSVDREGTSRIEIVFGRALVWSEAAHANVGVIAGGLSGVFTLAPRQPLGIEVELTRDRGSDPTVVPPGLRAVVTAAAGGRFRQTEGDGGVPGTLLAGLELEQPLPPRGGMHWDSAAPGAARIMPMVQEPAWMKLTGPVRAVDRHAAAAMAEALAADVPAGESLRMVAQSRRVEERMAAAATLALLGDFELLVEMLCDESPERRLREGEWTALERDTVPTALARGANAAGSLRQAFARKGPPGRESELFLLARGLSADELAAGGAEGLVKSLEDASLVIRRYALANLVSLLPASAEATRDYRPDRSMLLNDRGLIWWRGQLAAGLAGNNADAAEGP